MTTGEISLVAALAGRPAAATLGGKVVWEEYKRKGWRGRMGGEGKEGEVKSRLGLEALSH